MLKNKVHALINFTGLTLGLALALLIAAYIRFETSYNTFHSQSDRLYRITNISSFGRMYALTPPPITVYIKEYFSGVEEVGRMYERSVSIKTLDGKEPLEEERIFFTDSTIHKMLSLEFAKGNSANPLAEKFAVLIMAKKYFIEFKRSKKTQDT